MTLLQQYIVNGRSTPGEVQENFPAEQWPGIDWMDEALQAGLRTVQ